MESPKSTELELQQLVRMAQGGDCDAFGTLYDLFFDQIYRYTSFRVQEELAEDLVSDIFVKAWEKLNSYKPQKNVPFGAWLFRIARYTVIDSYRSHQTLEEVPEDIEDEDVFNRAETRVKRKHLLHTVRSAMGELPKKYRDILELSFMAELPNAEIARVLRMREGAVRTQKSRALKKLELLLPPEICEKV
ncbi:sigma-70 family RNA polymerase sigma factor [Candidatus Peregrinibacteria bacterium]|jgi:RNA polymerase sigma-70 factor, ECF subfamily|nr:sigma-70 family RNA polymerase sigma factor [Candidatus Peregrinibacteria bacterium]MBT3598800.1 sigma-70 family RNA polymerase sigma factor [Candidatus Peregrinibacteria bacterium]MBT4366839.1 sigma-70 family RNA polymerase sigma factor [Candidatus Peregrinibacteria bacterium]MBT4585378.1 sigma-70 family RNA polymerase sigma factor [Candidatus Peregrinibacteria bacterium]MBT6731190.1 sigma-70 family RNA polymerase sigma factor [Candidatus Peregrinibacteria bacterium]